MNSERQEILERLAEILDEIAGVSAAQVTPASSFIDDLDIDSLAFVEIGMAVEDAFGVEVADEDLGRLTTVGDVIDYVLEAGVNV